VPPVRQYDRGARVWIFPPQDLGAETQAPLVINREVPISGLPARVQSAVGFSVQKTLTPQPNGATIRLWNLTPSTRDRISGVVRRVVDWLPDAAVVNIDGQLRPGGNEVTSQLAGMCGVRLEVGYSGGLGQAFSGTVTRVRTVRQGADRVTELACTDGGFQVGVATANRVFLPKTPALTVVEYLAETLGLELAQTTGLAAFAGFTLQGGLNCSGDPLAAITDILAVLDLGWWIEDGQLWILADGELLPGQAIVVSTQPLPNAVRLWSEPEVLDQGALRIRCTLAPQIRLGHAVAVTNSDLRGTYRVESVQHGGFNRGGAYETQAVVRNPATVF